MFQVCKCDAHKGYVNVFSFDTVSIHHHSEVKDAPFKRVHRMGICFNISTKLFAISQMIHTKKSW